MIKCSKCGFENLETANFCAECGASLEKEKKVLEEEKQEYLCPKCGNRFIGKQKFCQKCGLKFNWPAGNYDEVPIKVNKKFYQNQSVKTSNNNEVIADKSGGNKIISIVLNAVVMLAILLSFIGIWTNYASIIGVSGEAANQLFGLKYWFDTIWKTDQVGYYIGSFIAFIIAIVCSIVFGVIGTVKAVKNIRYGYDFKLLPTQIIGSISVLVYGLIAFATAYTKITTEGIIVELKYGPALSLAVTSVTLLIAVFVADKIIKFIKTREGGIARLVISSLVPILALVGCMVIGNAALYGSASDVKKYYSGISGALLILEDQANFFTSTIAFAGLTYALIFISVFAGALALIPVLGKNKTKIFFSILPAVLSILAIIFAALLAREFNIDTNNYYCCGLAAGIIVGAVLLVASAVLTIIDKCLEKRVY